MAGPGFTTVGISNEVIEKIKKIILETKLYKNPTEFINIAVLEKIDVILQRQVDQRRLEAFFIRHNEIRAEHLKKEQKT
jgi:hypothetical protein